MEETASDRTSLLYSNGTPNHGDYSTFAAGRSIDSGLVASVEPGAPRARVDDSTSIGDDTRERLSISWSKINAFVDLPGPSCWQRLCGGSSEAPRSKQVLFGVNGKLKAGTFLAIMGASGAGKTTLLNVLAHRNIRQLHVTGAVEVNDRPIGKEINSVSAYIQQEDLFMGSLTVREHLTFQAFLRMEKYISNDERLARVERLIVQFGLKKVAESIIGIPGRVRGLSGGEKKRLSFASEVLTDPPLLFVDEPTSGLDSFMAQSLITVLQDLAAQGRTIVCTIHQPSSEVYAMFDSILLLAEGRVAYMGSAAEAIGYFKSLGYPCPSNFNPADYFVHSLAILPGDEDNSRQRVMEICDEYSARESEDSGRQDSIEREDSFKDDVNFRRSPYKASWCRQFGFVFWRSWITNNRDVVIFRIRIYQSIFVGLIAGIIYFQLKINQDSVLNIAGAIFFLLTSITFTNLGAVTFTFPAELPVFLRDHHNGMYRTDVYFLAKTFSETPLFVFNPLLLVAIAYWMIGLRNSFLRFLYSYGTLALVSLVAVSYGYIVSTAAPSVTAAAALTGPVILPLLLLGGFYIKTTTIPEWLVWLRYLSWFSYGYEILLVNQWDDYGTINCNSTNSASKNHLTNSSASNNCPYPTGNEAINSLGLDSDNVLNDIYCLVALAVGFRLISYLLLLRKAHKKP